jgi:transcription initiation factor TFIIB
MDRDMGEVVCGACGLVIGDVMLDRKPEWRAFTLAEKDARMRVGAPTSYLQYDKGLSTTFRPNEGSTSRQTSLKMRRLRKWNVRSRLHSSSERNLSQAMNELERLSDKLKLPRNVREIGARIYRKALDKGLVRGRSISAVAAAALYAACRTTRTPRTLKELSTASLRGRKEISRCYRLILREVNPRLPIDDPAKYIPKIASTVALSQRAQNEAVKILRDAGDRGMVSGKGPVGLAAAALYVSALLTGEEVTQQNLANASGVTEVTIRNRYKGLRNGLDYLKEVL